MADNDMGRLALFRNDRKTSDQQPDYRGTGEINGVPVKLSAWVRSAKSDGRKYISIAVQADAPPTPTSQDTDFDDGLGDDREQTRQEPAQRPQSAQQPQTGYDTRRPANAPQQAAGRPQQQNPPHVEPEPDESSTDDIPF